MIFFLVTDRFRFTMDYFLDGWASEEIRDRISIVPYERIGDIGDLPPATYIFSDLERLTAVQRADAVALHARLTRMGPDAVVLNDPARTLVRHELLTRLHREGVNDFRSYRVAETRRPERFPVFLRLSDEHRGSLTPLIHDQDTLDRYIARFFVMKRGLGRILMIEFQDTRDDEQAFRKYSVYFIGRHSIPKHMFVSSQWMVKRSDKTSARYVQDEAEFLSSNPHEEELRRIVELANVDYGRVDYGVVEGRVQVWEINTNPTVMTPAEKVKPERMHFKERFRDRVSEAFLELDKLPPPRTLLPTSIRRQAPHEPGRFSRYLRHPLIRRIQIGFVHGLADGIRRPLLAALERRAWGSSGGDG